VAKHRFPAFAGRIKMMLKKDMVQHQSLTNLQSTDELVVVQCDNNIGPSTIEMKKYMKLLYNDHLNNRTTNTFIPPEAFALQANRVKKNHHLDQ
jgi:hypothetical protein